LGNGESSELGLVRGEIEAFGRKIRIGGPKPELKEGETAKRYTYSLCPECYAILPAVIFERDEKVWIKRVCPNHGEIDEIYWSDADLYEKVMRYETPAMRIRTPYESLERPCPFSCGLCAIHVSQTCLANVVATNRCDLSCWYCFFYAERANIVYEPTLEQYREMIRVLAKQHPIGARALQLTGGEPMLRDDLVELVRIAKEEGIDHIQLNTHGIRFLRPDGVELTRKLKSAGLNTVYLSFDGVSPGKNPKNHWEVPYILDNLRKGGMRSVVLVPTVIRGWNTDEIGSIIKFAALNIDVVRGVNFQPLSITGMVPKLEREKCRITIPDVIKLIEEQTGGQISKSAWYPVPTAYIISKFLELLSGKERWHMRIHPSCGMATYVYVSREDGGVRYVPITEMMDVDGFLEYLKKTGDMERGENRYIVMLKMLLKLRGFLRKENMPKEFSPLRIIFKAFVKQNYRALADFHYKFLYLGLMHFMDLYNYDLQRVMRCGVHYATPDLRVIPFCTFNVLPDLYRDRLQEKYGVSLEDYAKKYGGTVGEVVKYKRNVEALESGEPYQRTYAPFLAK